MLTDNEVLIRTAEKHYDDFPVAAYNVHAQKIKRYYTKQQQCDLDIKTSRNLIGEVVNTASEINTMIWDSINHGASINDVNDMYLDACLLNIMSNIEIDKAKKEFNVDCRKELTLLEKKYARENEDGKRVKPNFFAAKDRSKGYYDTERKVYQKHRATMDYLQTAINSYRSRKGRQHQKREFVAFADIVTRDGYDHRNVWKPKIERAVNLVRQSRNDINAIYMDDGLSHDEQVEQAKCRRQDCIDYVGEIEMSRNTMIYFLKHLDDEEYSDIRRHIFNTLFGYPNTAFYELIIRSATPIPMLVEDATGDIELFGIHYRYDYKNVPNHTT